MRHSGDEGMDADLQFYDADVLRQEEVDYLKRLRRALAEAAFARESEMSDVSLEASRARTSAQRLREVIAKMNRGNMGPVNFVPDAAADSDTSEVALPDPQIIVMLNSDEEEDDDLPVLRTSRDGLTLELEVLQSLVDEITKQAKNHEEILQQMKHGHVETTRKLLEKQETQMMKHLKQIQSMYEKILRERMLFRMKMLKRLRRTEENLQSLQATIDMAEEVYKNAVEKRDEWRRHVARTRTHNEGQKRKSAANEDADGEPSSKQTMDNKAKSVIEDVEGQVSYQCCICLRALGAFVKTSGRGESSSSKKVLCLRAACFMPCMHANVCTVCAEKTWYDGPRVCPVCKEQLSEKPGTVFF